MKEERVVSTPPPKLALNSSFSSSRRGDRRAETWSTPPIQLPGAVPFRWEEAPGKPKHHIETSDRLPFSGLSSARDCKDERKLEIPPRLSASASERRGSGCRRFNSHASPVAVLDGPYSFIRRAASFRFARNKGADCSARDAGEPRLYLDSSSSSSFSGKSDSVDEGGEEGGGEVRILRYRKRRPILRTASHFLSGVFGRMKHAMVPYRKDHNEHRVVPDRKDLVSSISL